MPPRGAGPDACRHRTVPTAKRSRGRSTRPIDRDAIASIPTIRRRQRRRPATTIPIRKAIFPVAGLGTRLLPATKAQPKEMLPVVDKPLIQFAVEEADAADMREMIFVTGRHKRPTEDHFDMTCELEVALEQAAKAGRLDMVRRVVGREPFAVLRADDLMVGETPVLQQMIEQFRDWRASILAVQKVPAEHTRRYGILDDVPVDERMLDLTRIVEKPAHEQAPSRLGVAGRYILTPGVFDEGPSPAAGASQFGSKRRRQPSCRAASSSPEGAPRPARPSPPCRRPRDPICSGCPPASGTPAVGCAPSARQ